MVLRICYQSFGLAQILWLNDLSIARMGEKRNAYRLLVGKPEGRRLLGRPRRRWVGDIRIGLGEV
jgi:hypothetical protein